MLSRAIHLQFSICNHDHGTVTCSVHVQMCSVHILSLDLSICRPVSCQLVSVSCKAQTISCQSSVPLEDGFYMIAIAAGPALSFHQNCLSSAAAVAYMGGNTCSMPNCTRGFCKIPCSCQRSELASKQGFRRSSGT